MATTESSEVGPGIIKGNASEGSVLSVEDEGVSGSGIEHECRQEVWERCSEACMRGEDFKEHGLAGKADDDAALTIEDRGVRTVIR